jgi:ribosomal protein RSM22 (predicted rRNA methylase)
MPMKDDLKILAANVDRLSHLLTRERSSLPAAYLKDAGLREAYRTYFLPPNLQKIRIALAELGFHPAKPLDAGRLRVLDLGAGPGTALLGVLEFFGALEKKPVLDCTAVDHVAENLQIAEELFNTYRSANRLTATLKTVRSNILDVLHLAVAPFDLVILSNVLNELFSREGRRTEKRIVVLEDIMTRFVVEGGSCIIIEPALRETSRDLLEVRNAMLHAGFTIYAPCVSEGWCPALANPKDWCHEDIAWEAPPLIQELDRHTGLRKDSLKFSWLVLRKDGITHANAFGEGDFRVVSEPLVSKGKREFYICGAKDRKLVTRLDKDSTVLNEAFENLRRGDTVRFNGLIDEEKRCKVGKETGVAIVHRLSWSRKGRS